jgi:hypothetical protein
MDFTAAVSSAFAPAGYFADPGSGSGAANVEAATAAALEALHLSRASPTKSQRSAVETFMHARLTQPVANPYQACSIARSLGYLNAPAPREVAMKVLSWWNATGRNRRTLASLEDVLDAYGTACVARLFPSLLGSVIGEQKSVLESALSRPGDAMINYYLANAWVLSGGGPARLGVIADTAAANITAEGVTYSATTKLGTLGNSLTAYRILKLENVHRVPVLSDHLVTELLADRSQSAISRLEIAALTKNAGRPDRNLISTASASVISTMPNHVTLANARAVVYAIDLLVDLGIPSTLSLDIDLPHDSAEGRYYAWELLSHQDHLSAAANDALSWSIAALPDALKYPAKQTMAELSTAVEAALATRIWSPDYKSGVRAAIASMHACPELANLYRAAQTDSPCDLAATLDALRLHKIMTD